MNERSRTTAASASRLLPSPRTSRGFDAGRRDYALGDAGTISVSPEALELYVEGLREDGRSLEMGIVRRTLPLPP